MASKSPHYPFARGGMAELTSRFVDNMVISKHQESFSSLHRSPHGLGETL
ncbi:MAG: hypothetical protein FWG10_10170 [Eubacteriaceae bacterium]|nr:hypothetical protein [Eubacteriaceae bacterium]